MTRTASRAGWWAIGLFAALRLSYLGQYLELPFVFGPLFDSQVYFDQADAVRAGRFGDATLLAFSPLYGYFLALLGAGPGSLLPLVVQLGLGGLNVWLIYRLTARLFDAKAGVWASLCYALYGPLMFFETKIMSETLGLTFLLAGTHLYASPRFASGDVTRSLGCGVLLALSVLTRASLLFCLPLFVLLAAFREEPPAAVVAQASARPEGRARMRALWKRCCALAFTLGASLALYGSFTYAQSGLFVPVILTSKTLSQANQAEWTGSLAAFAQEPTQGVATTNVVDQARVRLRAVQKGLPDPERARPAAAFDVLNWARHAPHKAALTLRDQETTFDYGYYGERTEVPALHVTWMSFGLIASLALGGAWLSLRRRRFQACVVLLPIFLGILATTTLFHPSTRYRLPLLIAFAPFAGHLLAEARLRWNAGHKALAIAASALALGFLVRSESRTLTQPAFWELRVAESAALANDLDECRARVARAHRLQPASESVASRAQYVGKILPACLEPSSEMRRQDALQ